MPSGIHETPLDWLLRTPDHYPQIIGTFDTLANTVTIQVWDITDGKNVLMSVANSGCYAIGDTGRWGWSTNNLPTTISKTTHYAYTMYSNLDERFSGQFVLDVPEGSKWFHPRNRNDFINSI